MSWTQDCIMNDPAMKEIQKNKKIHMPRARRQEGKKPLTMMLLLRIMKTHLKKNTHL